MKAQPKKQIINWGSNSPTPENNSSQIAANNPFLPATDIQASENNWGQTPNSNVPSNDIEAIASPAPKKRSAWKAALRSAAKYFLIGAAIATFIAVLIMIPYIPTMSFVFIAVCALGAGLTASILAGIHAYRAIKAQKAAPQIPVETQPYHGAEPTIENPFSQTNNSVSSEKQNQQDAFFDKKVHTEKSKPNFVYSQISNPEDSDDEISDYSGLPNNIK